MSLWRDTIIRNAEGRVRTEDSLEVRLQEFCDKHKRNIEQYTITDDGFVNCLRFVTIFDDDLVDGKLPFKFGKVEGNFSCIGCNELTSLEGCPKEVGKTFGCCECPEIKSLDGCPEIVGEDFCCWHCGVPFYRQNIRHLCKVNRDILTTLYY